MGRVSQKALQKKLQNKFGVSRKCFYLCSPNKNGGIQKEAKGAMPAAIQDERFNR